jgi:cysteine sulfinate desulfinase/cysteine desulfurase-like protein
MVYYESEVFQAFRQRVYQIILEAASDTNLNVQIRNSWTLANMSFIDSEQMQDEYLAQETLIISTIYALSNKEKVASNGLRALGYYLKRADFKELKDKILVKINKSQQ